MTVTIQLPPDIEAVTPSTAKAFMAIAVDEHPHGHQYPAAPHAADHTSHALAVESVARLLAAGEVVYFVTVQVVEKGQAKKPRRIFTLDLDLC